ncbi:FAD:protein FMN transferase [Marinisporobacter balticus]|uniref:FAD:protein FMN transferase n=1 Tax=Marinisporobacter balticus TaxID=2018667 RepID=A0A4R2L418_9FIRM|nr:FAD:protein FMN transferase [Marinisporobacter balticus]TCO79977.1 thiamine biosynthesis lipoprotein [Marinisporobacter balticus]
MSKRMIILVIMLILLFTIALQGCSNKKEVVTRSTFMLNTKLDISVWIEDKNRGVEIIQECFKRISEIEEKMSVNIENSEVNKINDHTQKEFISVSKDTSEVLNASLKYAKLSNGAFDPTIGKLVELWGIGKENFRVPKKAEIDEVLRYVDYQLLINNGENKFKLAKDHMRIDLGGIAKGYAGDEVYKIIKKNSVEGAIINLGGNIIALGTKIDGSNWRIGIQDPFEPTGTHIGVVEASDKAIVSSGNYERFSIVNEKRYHHIIDPKTGYPSENGIISATIIANYSMDADALSTAVYVLGVEKGLELIENMENVESIIITKDYKVYLSSGIKGAFEIKNNKFQIVNQD